MPNVITKEVTSRARRYQLKSCSIPKNNSPDLEYISPAEGNVEVIASSQPSTSGNPAQTATDHTYSLESPCKLKRKLDADVTPGEEYKCRLKLACQREKRLRMTISSVLEKLNAENLLTVELKCLLDAYKDIPVDLFQKPTTSYSEEQHLFVTTLHLYGAKAYEFARKHMPLPNPRTLRRMGRRKLNPCRKYFEFNKAANKNRCKVCNAVMTGDHGANLERHLKRRHEQEFQDVQQSKAEKIEKRGLPGNSPSCDSNASDIEIEDPIVEVMSDVIPDPRETGESSTSDVIPDQGETGVSSMSDVIPDLRKKEHSSTLCLERILNGATINLPTNDIEEDIIAKVWAFKLKRIKRDQRIFVEKFISDILLEGELGTLNRNSVKINENYNSFASQPDSS